MHTILQGMRTRLYQLNLTQRLVLGLVLLVLALIVFSSLPANIAFWLQIERQVLLRVEEAQASTQALYDAERTRLKKLAGIIAERPTLYRLVQEKDQPSLAPYLQTLKESSNLDFLVVHTPDLQAGEQLGGLPNPQTFLDGNQPYFADFISLGEPPAFFILAVSQIPPSTEEMPLLGWVILGRQLKNEDMQTLEEQTGMAQSLIVNGQRVAFSLAEISSLPIDLQATDDPQSLNPFCCSLRHDQGETYYIGHLPLVDQQGKTIAQSEVVLTGGAIRRSMVGTMAISAAISLVLILVGTALFFRLASTITLPLQRLGQAADQVSQGNFEPWNLPESSIPEINQLSTHLDHARRQLRQMLTITQQEMKHTERLLASIREGVIAIDHDERITFINQDALYILGQRSENVLHRPVGKVFPPAPNEHARLEDLLQKKSADDVQVRRLSVLNAQGQPLLLSVRLSQPQAETSNHNRPERVLVIHDLTEEEAVNRLRYNFLANVAHEFRTPLAGIAATTELLVEEGNDLSPEELNQLVETISLSTLHLQTLVDNLLESTTIEAGVFQVHRRPIQMSDVTQKVADLMMPLFLRRDQVLTVSLPKQLPTLWADPNRLAQVLVNLLSNASKFSAMGSVIELTVSQENERLRIAVLDSGPGLPAERYADLFKRFVTGSQPGETQYGIGLGLSVVKSIVEMHGGQVGAENRPEGGANVWFTIPITPPEEKENP